MGNTGTSCHKEQTQKVSKIHGARDSRPTGLLWTDEVGEFDELDGPPRKELIEDLDAYIARHNLSHVTTLDDGLSRLQTVKYTTCCKAQLEQVVTLTSCVRSSVLQMRENVDGRRSPPKFVYKTCSPDLDNPAIEQAAVEDEQTQNVLDEPNTENTAFTQAFFRDKLNEICERKMLLPIMVYKGPNYDEWDFAKDTPASSYLDKLKAPPVGSLKGATTLWIPPAPEDLAIGETSREIQSCLAREMTACPVFAPKCTLISRAIYRGEI